MGTEIANDWLTSSPAFVEAVKRPKALRLRLSTVSVTDWTETTPGVPAICLRSSERSSDLLGFFTNAAPTQVQNPRTTSAARQNLTMNLADPMALFENGLTGVPMVDQWVKSVNPHGYQRRATISSVDRPRTVRRINT